MHKALPERLAYSIVVGPDANIGKLALYFSDIEALFHCTEFPSDEVRPLH
jgi:hypothetical protein